MKRVPTNLNKTKNYPGNRYDYNQQDELIGAGEANKSLDSKPKRTHWRIVAQKMNENDFH